VLREIEAALARRRSWTIGELARALGIEPALARAGIETLARLGRLSRETWQGAEADAACGACPLRASCRAAAPGGRC